NILIIAATEMEVIPLMSAYFEADYFITGVGSPATVYHLLKKIASKKYDVVLQVGVAGSFDESLKLGEVVLVNADCFADLGAIENKNFYSLFDLKLNNENDFPLEIGWLINQHPFNTSLRFVKGISVNCLTDEAEKITLFKEKYQADIESMEGAALHFVCLQERIPFLQIRGISNFVGERDKSKWDLKSAVENSNNAALQILKSM
ncbi:MAG: futalosine hydrolase, partial [Sphingobacteriales bacterium]|nr:futalosine hydrolase [Sphingobacteriales bacterium]